MEEQGIPAPEVVLMDTPKGFLTSAMTDRLYPNWQSQGPSQTPVFTGVRVVEVVVTLFVIGHRLRSSMVTLRLVTAMLV